MIYGPITDQLCTLSVFCDVVTTNLFRTVVFSSHFCLQLHFHRFIPHCVLFFLYKRFIPSNSEIPQMSFLIRSSLLIHSDIPRSLSSLLPVLQFYVQISSGNLQNIFQQNCTLFWAIIPLPTFKYIFIIHSTKLKHLDMNLHCFPTHCISNHMLFVTWESHLCSQLFVYKTSNNSCNKMSAQ